MPKDSRLPWSLVLLSFIAIIGIAHFKVSLELEDAEQAYYTQWWRLGYDDQPPLYTWLQKLVNTIFGVNKFSLAFLRALLFSSILGSMFLLGKRLLKHVDQAKLVVLSLALVPVFMDFAFRRLSHTLLLCLVIVLSCLVFVNLMERKTLQNYIFMGVCLGVGILSKYNYALFIMAFLLAAFVNKDVRYVFLNSRFMVSVVIALVLFVPHLYWILVEQHLGSIGESVAVKMEGKEGGIPVVTPIFKMFTAFFQATFPLILVTVLLMIFKKLNGSRSESVKWVFHLFLAQITVLVLFFAMADVRNVESRWLLPLLLPFLVLLVEKMSYGSGRLVQWGTYVFMGLLVFQTLRTPIEKWLGIVSDNQFDYSPLSMKLENEYPDAVWILPNVTYGGQLRVLNTDKTIFTLDDFSIPDDEISAKKSVVLTTSRNFLESSPIDSLLQYGPDADDIFFFKVEDASKAYSYE